MPRQPRFHLPNVPLHIVQRGHNRQPCFFSDVDYACYLRWLAEALNRTACTLQAYALMTNHVHLLLTPVSTDAVPRLVSWLGLQYVSYINRKYGRTGTLWDSRYKSSLVQTEHYVLACQRYIEFNPVRAAIVAHPCNYRWSSCRFHALGQSNSILTPRPEYLALGTCATERQRAYRSLIEATLDETVKEDIRTSLSQNRPCGDARFHATVRAMTGRHSMPQSRGRPPREKGA